MRKHRPEETNHGASNKRRDRGLWALLALSVAVSLGGLSIGELLRRLDSSGARISELESRLESQRSGLYAMRREALERADEVASRSAHDLQATIESLSQDQVRLQRSISGQSAEVKKLLHTGKLEREELITSLRGEIHYVKEDLSGMLQRSLQRQRSSMDRFREIQEWADPSVLLIHSEFKYRLEGSDELETGSGWGTGFVVSAEGHVITNKHVVQPWKFDPELCAMSALGEVDIKADSLKLFAWPTGTACLDSKKKLIYSEGFSNSVKRNLRLLGCAKDSMVTREFEFAGAQMNYPIHDLNDNDLAVLKVDGGNFRPLPLASEKSPARIRKLEPVMALGFPRGKNGLEAGRATTSPSLGTVRKVERTIHITASIIPGNSGGPLFNTEGQVIGIATRIFSETLGICLKAEHASRLLDTICKKEAARTLATKGKAPK